MSALSLSYWESDVYRRHNNKHFAELAPQIGRNQLIWRNCVTVTLCISENCHSGAKEMHFQLLFERVQWQAIDTQGWWQSVLYYGPTVKLCCPVEVHTWSRWMHPADRKYRFCDVDRPSSRPVFTARKDGPWTRVVCSKLSRRRDFPPRCRAAVDIRRSLHKLVVRDS